MRDLTMKRQFRRRMPRHFVWRTAKDERAAAICGCTVATGKLAGEDLWVAVPNIPIRRQRCAPLP